MTSPVAISGTPAGQVAWPVAADLGVRITSAVDFLRLGFDSTSLDW